MPMFEQPACEALLATWLLVLSVKVIFLFYFFILMVCRQYNVSMLKFFDKSTGKWINLESSSCVSTGGNMHRISSVGSFWTNCVMYILHSISCK